MTFPRLCRSITSTMAHTPIEVRLLCFERCASLGKTSVKKGGDFSSRCLLNVAVSLFKV